MNKNLLFFLCGLLLLSTNGCKSTKINESFSSGEAFSASSLDSQLLKVKRLLPEAEVKRSPKGIQVTFASGILFDVNSSSLSEPAKQQLQKLAGLLEAASSSQVLVEGHTDVTGTTELNKSLSEKRAAAVKTYLVSQGIAPERILTVGYGEARPIATNSTRKGQEKNRRVEVFIRD